MNEEGEQKQIGDKPEEVGTVSRGSYSYELEGVTYTVNWVADENGFQASGAHLPVAPPHARSCCQALGRLESRWTTRINSYCKRNLTSFCIWLLYLDIDLFDKK